MKKLFGTLIATTALTVAAFTVNAQAPSADIPADMNALMSKYTCIACHRPNQRLVGPAYADVAKKNYSNEEIVNLIYNPVPSHWPGYPPMAAMKQVPKEDAMKLAVWINSLDGDSGTKKARPRKRRLKRPRPRKPRNVSFAYPSIKIPFRTKKGIFIAKNGCRKSPKKNSWFHLSL